MEGAVGTHIVRTNVYSASVTLQACNKQLLDLLRIEQHRATGADVREPSCLGLLSKPFRGNVEPNGECVEWSEFLGLLVHAELVASSTQGFRSYFGLYRRVTAHFRGFGH